MKRSCTVVVLALTLSLIVLPGSHGQQPTPVQPSAIPASPPSTTEGYVLGPEDRITVRVLGVDEIPDKPIAIATDGSLSLPLLGRLTAAGLTVKQLESDLAQRLSTYVLEPDVTVSISEFHSQPVSVLGAVNKASVLQIEGRKTLVEVISLAGGLSADAGPTIRVSRRAQYGPIPLPTAKMDRSGQFSVAEVRTKELLEANHPEDNISVRPHDVITVPTAEKVYVIGHVNRPGAFALNEKDQFSVLKALALAGGLKGATAAASKSRIIRKNPTTLEGADIPVDVRKILAGKRPDVALMAEDILFVPASSGRAAALRALELAAQTASGVTIWRAGKD